MGCTTSASRPSMVPWRAVIGALSRCAWSTVRDLYRSGLQDLRVVPGMMVSIQTYGDHAANRQPHLHTLVSAGVFDPEGEFTAPELPPTGVAEELFPRRVIRILVRRGEARRGRGRGAALLEALWVLGAPRDPRGSVGHGGRRAAVSLPGASADRSGAAAS